MASLLQGSARYSGAQSACVKRSKGLADNQSSTSVLGEIDLDLDLVGVEGRATTGQASAGIFDKRESVDAGIDDDAAGGRVTGVELGELESGQFEGGIRIML